MRALIALRNFIADTGQLEDVADFFTHQLEYAPVAIAHFTSPEEAEAWLKGAEEPPSPARILIGDEYYQFWYMREDNTRGMYRDYAIEPALEALTARGIPPQVPSFATRPEAEEWLMRHPADPYAFVSIAGAGQGPARLMPQPPVPCPTHRLRFRVRRHRPSQREVGA